MATDDFIRDAISSLNHTTQIGTSMTVIRASPWPGFNSSIREHANRYLLTELGSKRKDLGSVVVLTIVYSLIFLTGLIGNICTCIVILKNGYMHSATNCYLLNLALADVLTLIFALPPELYTVWEAYPWRFGETFCLVKSFLSEMTYNTSVLTITAFTVERYVAIYYPLKAQTIFTLNRAVLVTFATWILACLCAVPYPIYTRVFFYSHYPDTGMPVLESLLCNIPLKWQDDMRDVFEISTFLFFVTPMVVITVMYVLIGVKIRTSEPSPVSRGAPQTKSAAAKARRAVVKMLVAVVVAFFVCWAPFHSQRLMTLYIKSWNEELLAVQSHVFYISGVLYFFSSTVNPILYNLLSRKFRRAFKRTFCRCCASIDGLPAFYRLKAKFLRRQRAESTQVGRCLRAEKPILLASFNNNIARSADGWFLPRHVRPSSKDTYVGYTTNMGSSGAHAHSDGRLQRQCRHKYCSCRLTRPPRFHDRMAARSYSNMYYSIPCDRSRDGQHICDVTCGRVTDKKASRECERSLRYLPEFDSATKCREWRLDNSLSGYESCLPE